MNHTNFYVYLLFRDNGMPFYIGKGTGDRWNYHERDARNNNQHCHENPHKINIIRKMFENGWTEVPKIKIANHLSHAKACEYEVEWIAALGRWPGGLLVNMTNGGEGAPGMKHSQATLDKRSAALRGRKRSTMHCEKLAMANLGKKASEVTREKMSAAHRGKRRSPEHCANLSRALLGNSPTLETRVKLSVSHRGQSPSLETRTKLSAALRGKPKSPEHRAKIRAANKQRSKAVLQTLKELQLWQNHVGGSNDATTLRSSAAGYATDC
jgi:hypothetical protein